MTNSVIEDGKRLNKHTLYGQNDVDIHPNDSCQVFHLYSLLTGSII